ncbi:MAG: RimK family alpha-L-glutamate ligase [Desulfobacterales bacterium]|nr:RimK family alpha-L-glutamate ligase [Desulfobacterales bacterium]
MHIDILSVNDQKYHPNQRLIEAGSKLGHKVRLIHPKYCLSQIHNNKVCLETKSDEGQIEILLPRLGATISQYALILVRHFELVNCRVINGYESILLAKNKFMALQKLASSGISVPDTYYVSNFKNFEKAVKGLGGYPVVVKVPSGRQGTGVALVESEGAARQATDSLLKKRQGLLVQEFISPQQRKELRVFILGNRVVAAMELRPKDGDFRSNIHLEGQGKAVKLSKELSELSIRSASSLGLEISGVDIIIDAKGLAKVIEVNYSPGFRGLETSTGLDIASGIIQYVTQM